MCRSRCILLFLLLLDLLFGQLPFGEGAHGKSLQLLFANPLEIKPVSIKLLYPDIEDTFTFRLVAGGAGSLSLFTGLLIFSRQYYPHYIFCKYK